MVRQLTIAGAAAVWSPHARLCISRTWRSSPLLGIAIATEVVATTSMKALDGFNKPLPLLLVVVGYALAFAMLALVMRSIPVGVAYALWSGLGIVLVSMAALLIYGQKLDWPALLGMSTDHWRAWW